MGSSSDEDVQVLLDQFGDENTKDVRYFDHMDDVARKDFSNQCLFQALNAKNLNLDLEKLRGENQALAKKISVLEAKNQEGDGELQRLRDQEASMDEDLARACLSLRSNILAGLKVRDPKRD
ncbi:hypothetical protein JCGZ_17155 [Jatropha curcas]|uniref:Uncharacterized protein n=1 Tax=Jatropha curcas TaxID=180498 RepID=A0A067KDH0_JATCU|nr:hypothetical protein JCGZ_17155 [Jatropha curcas]